MLETCRERGIPVAVTMAGGYASDVEDTVDIHFQSIERAADLDWRGTWPVDERTHHDVSDNPRSCVVVGAGISGLLAARKP